MGTVVSSKTIRKITENATYFKEELGAPITVPEFKSQTLEKLKKICDAGKDLPSLADRRKSGGPLSDEERKVYDARTQYSKLTEAFNNIPKGFELVPLVYSRISPKQNKDVQKEFSRYVKPKFMKFLAREHAEDLKKLGICDFGIQRMSKGLDPADRDGNHYDLSVDHVIERSGSGKLGLEKAIDPLLPEGAKPTYKVNHLRNFILLPNTIHDGVKNLINDTQRLYDLPPGEAGWGFMVIPERDEKNPGFVYVPHADDVKAHGLRHRNMSGTDTVNHLSYTLKQADQELSEFVNRPLVKQAMRAMEQAAGGNRKRLENILYKQEVQGQSFHGKESLSKIFNDLLEYDPHAKQMYDNRIVPLFSELYMTYDQAKLTDDQELSRQLTRVLTSQQMRTFKNRAASIPVKGMGSGAALLDKLTDGSQSLKDDFTKAKQAKKQKRRESKKDRTTKRSRSRSQKRRRTGR